MKKLDLVLCQNSVSAKFDQISALECECKVHVVSQIFLVSATAQDFFKCTFRTNDLDSRPVSFVAFYHNFSLEFFFDDPV